MSQNNFDTIKGLSVFADTINNLNLQKEKDILYYDYLWIALYSDKNYNYWIYFLSDIIDVGNTIDIQLYFMLECDDYLSYITGKETILNCLKRSTIIYLVNYDYEDKLNIKIKRMLFENIPKDYLPGESSYYT